MYQSIPQAVIGLIVFAAEQIIQSETESKDQEQLKNRLEKIVADGINDNRDDDQSELAIEHKYFTNGNNGFRRNDCRMQSQATVNVEANPDINITKISASTPLHNVNGSYELGGNGCGTQLLAVTNENGLLNYQAIDNTRNERKTITCKLMIVEPKEMKTDKDLAMSINMNKKLNFKSNEKTKLKGIESLHTFHPEQKQEYPNISQSKSQPPLIFTSSELCYVKGKVVVPKHWMQPTNDHDSRSKKASQSPNQISPQRFQKLEPTPNLLTILLPGSYGELMQMQPQLLQTSPQNTPKATRSEQDPSNRNKDSTSSIKQKQSPIPRLTSRISWTEQERKEERREGRDLENCETDNDNEEMLDMNGWINSEIFRIMGNNQHERLHPIRIYPLIERQLEYLLDVTIVVDNEIQGRRRRSE
ncbi:MAG: hypothetical protein EZS28_037075, partial [Streblomastix strix]